METLTEGPTQLLI